MLLLLLQVPLALLDELVHGRGALGGCDGCSRGQRGLGQGRQGRSRFQFRGLLLADDWQERRRGSPCEGAVGVQVSPWQPLGQLPSIHSPPRRGPLRPVPATFDLSHRAWPWDPSTRPLLGDLWDGHLSTLQLTPSGLARGPLAQKPKATPFHPRLGLNSPSARGSLDPKRPHLLSPSLLFPSQIAKLPSLWRANQQAHTPAAPWKECVSDPTHTVASPHWAPRLPFHRLYSSAFRGQSRLRQRRLPHPAGRRQDGQAQVANLAR